jgi:hypothetical protein
VWLTKGSCGYKIQAKKNKSSSRRKGILSIQEGCMIYVSLHPWLWRLQRKRAHKREKTKKGEMRRRGGDMLQNPESKNPCTPSPGTAPDSLNLD